MTLAELENSPLFFGLFAARSGAGKSVAISSFAEYGGVYVFDIDKRARGMRGVNILTDEQKKLITIDQSIDVSKGYQALYEKLEVLSIKQKNRQLTEKTIVIESFPTLVKMLIYDSQRLRGQEKSFTGKERGALKFIHPDDYNYASAAVQNLVYNIILELKCNLIVSGWVVNLYGKEPGSNDYSPAVVIGQKILGPQNLAEEIVGYFDEVYFFEKEETGISNNPLKYTVCFESSLAKTSILALKGKGKVDITNKSFYQTYQKLLKGEKI